ncbi:Ger(x)C family spore germination protein [Paenibacillus sp. Soil787]|uniref:Ger(x)C family spore germination protein n=1 Tax=Paenibacillus sp. Soil787 TaxID=1736411 RepID=UPI0006FAC0E2|nr:Ger(x)C family spore germination protein [Paenibacillus sp. Soil787]KRF42275.1 spore gernimation protein GerC [Paenibacillus sp. Soil787]
MRKISFRFFFVWLLGISLLFLSGCWSRREIEDLGITVGLALDKGDVTQVEQKLKEHGGGYPKKDKITVTYQVVNPQAAGGEGKGGASQQRPYTNISETGDSMLQNTREISLRRDRPITGGHFKIIVIGEDLARTISMQQYLDFFIRDNEFRPSALVFISKGLASKTLELEDPSQIPSFNLLGITDNENRTNRLLPPMPLMKLIGKMHSKSSFLLQNVISADKETKFAGAGVILGKSNKLVGFLNEVELEGLVWITGKGKGGMVKCFDKETGKLLVYEISSMKSKIEPHVIGDNIFFEVKIESKGILSEHWMMKEKAFENEFLKRVEKVTETEVKRLVQETLVKIQKNYQADVAGFGDQLRIKYPKVWDKVKKDWDTTFSKVPVKFSVDVTIKEYGTTGSEKTK